MAGVHVHPQISSALSAGRPVVALESAVLTHGLPRSAMNRDPQCRPAGWRSDSPINLETMRAMMRAVHGSAAEPAIIALQDGSIRIGLDDASIESLARSDRALKASSRDLAALLARQMTAGTTVSATLAICAMTMRPSGETRQACSGARSDIRVFATGGIGGVHRAWTTLPDFSADLIELARTPMCVVCSGPKAVLDVEATAEALETLGVVVIGFQTDYLPRFYAAGDERERLAHRVSDVAEIAEICRIHWQSLGRASAVLVCQEPPRQYAMNPADLDHLIAQATTEAAARGVHGPALTPWLLNRIAALSDGKSLEANIALLIENCSLAGQIAAAMCRS